MSAATRKGSGDLISLVRNEFLLSRPQSRATRAFLSAQPPDDNSESAHLWLGQNVPVTGLSQYTSFQVKHPYLFHFMSQNVCKY